jgi:hypothetical protein
MSKEPYLPTLDELPMNPRSLSEELDLLELYRNRHRKGKFHEAFWNWIRSVLDTGPHYEEIIRNQALRIKELENADASDEEGGYVPIFFDPRHKLKTKAQAQNWIDTMISADKRHLWRPTLFATPDTE